MLINYLIDQMNDSKDYINEFHIGDHFLYYTVPYILSFISLITLIVAWIYHCSISKLVRRIKKEKDDGDPILKDLSVEVSIPIVTED